MQASMQMHDECVPVKFLPAGGRRVATPAAQPRPTTEGSGGGARTRAILDC